MSERKPTIVHFLVKGNINWMAVYGGAQPIPHLTAAGYRAAVLGVVADLAKAIRTRRLADVVKKTTPHPNLSAHKCKRQVAAIHQGGGERGLWVWASRALKN